jgi:Uma2 family endonuclease
LALLVVETILRSMAVALLKDPPLAPSEGLGPYRRRDYEALPAEPRCELIFGRFYLSPSPTVLHQIVVSLLWLRLHHIALEAGGIALFAPLDVGLADHSVVQPDVLYFSAARRKAVGERIEGAPDLVVEVLSPGTVRRDRGEKLSLYAQLGIREYWIVDPAERQIEFLVLRDGRFTVVLPAGVVYRSEALPEIRLDLAAFWRDVEERLA